MDGDEESPFPKHLSHTGLILQVTVSRDGLPSLSLSEGIFCPYREGERLEKNQKDTALQAEEAGEVCQKVSASKGGQREPQGRALGQKDAGSKSTSASHTVDVRVEVSKSALKGLGGMGPAGLQGSSVVSGESLRRCEPKEGLSTGS